MSDLSPEERALLESVRSEWGPNRDAMPPSAGTMRQRLQERPWLAERASFAPPRRFGRVALVTMAVASVFTLGTVAFLRTAPARSSSPVTAAVSTTPPAALEVAPAIANEAPSFSVAALPDAPPVAPPPNVVPPASAARTPAAAPASAASVDTATNTLAEELKLIRAAQGALREGAPELALSSLSSHASRFPHGVLRDERMTLEVLALCARGDIDAARAIRTELERTSPASSHLQRLASSCAR